MLPLLALLPALASASALPPTLEHRVSKGRYCIDWTDQGIHALGWKSDTDANGTPDAIDSIATMVGDAWTLLQDSLRFEKPPLDTAASCSLRVVLMDLYDPAKTSGQALGLTVGTPAGKVQVLLDNDRSPTGTAPTGTSQFWGPAMRSVVYHEMFHAFTTKFWSRDSSAIVAAEQSAQWFANTRQSYNDYHIKTETGNTVTRSLFEMGFLYGNWYWMEHLERTQGTKVVLDWIQHRIAVKTSVPVRVRDDSVFLSWFAGRGVSLEAWLDLFAADEALLLAGRPSERMPRASSNFSFPWSAMARAATLDTRGSAKRTYRLPPLSWLALESPRSWMRYGGQRLIVDPSGSPGRVRIVLIDHDSTKGTWTSSLKTLSAGAGPDTLVPPSGTTDRFVSIHSGADSIVVGISSATASTGCRLQVASILAGDRDLKGILDDGDLATSLEAPPNTPILVDLGVQKSFHVIDLGWKTALQTLGVYTITTSEDSLEWTPTIDFCPFNCMGRDWYMDSPRSIYAQWVKLTPQFYTGISYPLAEIALWDHTKSVTCLIEPTGTTKRIRAPEVRLHARAGEAILEAPMEGKLEWRSLDGRLVATFPTQPGKSTLGSPNPGAMLIATWTGASGRSSVRVPPAR